MDFQGIRQTCLEKKGSREDFPFGADIHVFKVGEKMFALLAEREGSLQLSLKCEPELAELYRKQYPAVTPGYHLNKRHWNTVTLDGSVPDGEILGMIELSYRLVFKGLRKIEREQISSSF
ncbi:MmcQ/YjbR family DNA-binding protein [Brevibacillus migulae]|uniref:MmcQ/YjbR family DNA-binding protein n=1 Tax=Brevibacillus migulae TaxID=1644114 RepID=UPI00106E0F51|nr:MmcQ/YjbR family DNA-binding protein [Brevibacillus migulae]